MQMIAFRGAGQSLFLGVVVFAAIFDDARADPPKGWGGGGQGYELTVDRAIKHQGEASGSVKAMAAGQPGPRFGSLTQAIRADEHRGKRLRMSAYVKTADVDQWAGLWMRVDGKDKVAIAFDLASRPIQGTTDWKQYEVVLDIPQEAVGIYFGFLLSGKGQAWVDDIQFAVAGDDVKTTGRQVEPRDRTGDPPDGLPEDAENLDFEE